MTRAPESGPLALVEHCRLDESALSVKAVLEHPIPPGLFALSVSFPLQTVGWSAECLIEGDRLYGLVWNKGGR
jgi:hypothetical protein